MRKLNVLIASLFVSSCCLTLASCQDSEYVISVCASEQPHKEILEGVVADILSEKGYELKVSVLDWTLQNDAVANNEYDANYFQHVPYLNTYQGKKPLAAACKVHYEKLCVYTNDKSDKTIDNGDVIEIVNDISNVERALNLLASYNILSINDSCYENGEFKNFNVNNPMGSVTFLEGYEDCELKCIKESLLCQSLSDVDFGVIPGNTAMTGFPSDYKDRICFGEEDEKLIDERANIIAVKEENLTSPKTLALVEALKDQRVADFISASYGETVVYHYVDLTK